MRASRSISKGLLWSSLSMGVRQVCKAQVRHRVRISLPLRDGRVWRRRIVQHSLSSKVLSAWLRLSRNLQLLVTLSATATAAEEEAQDEEEVQAGARDIFAHYHGAGSAEPLTVPRGYTTAPTFLTDSRTGDDALGWRCQVTYPTGYGKNTQMRWHEGYVIRARTYKTREGDRHGYLVYFDVDSQYEWIDGSALPVHSVCFRKAELPQSRVGEAALREAHKGQGENWADDEPFRPTSELLGLAPAAPVRRQAGGSGKRRER